jgi:hypothetical protein
MSFRKSRDSPSTFRKADNYTEINVLRKSKNNLDLGDINSLQKEHLQVFFSRCHATLGCVTAEYKAEFLN